MAQLNLKTSDLRELIELAEEREDEYINLDDTLYCFGTSNENAGGGQYLGKIQPQMILQPGSRRTNFTINQHQVERAFEKGEG